MQKKYFLLKISLIFILLFSILVNVHADDILPADEYQVDLTFEAVNAGEDNIILNAQSAIAIETSTKRILFAKNAYDKRAIASTTKIITAMVAIEYGKFEEVVTVSVKAAYTAGSVIKLKAGEKIKLLDLIYGLMLESGNDAAVAIAEHIAGSEEEYVKMMNKKVEDIGASNTHFVSVHGLDDDGHYSTAYDLAIITAECMKNETFRKIVSTAETSIQSRSLRNTNDLLFTYEGTTGVKTGFTGKAGRCLVASASRNGMEIITVALGCADKKTRFSDSRKLFEYIFKNYSLKKIIEKGQIITDIEIIKGKKTHVNLLSTETVILPMTDEEKTNYEIKITVADKIKAPCKNGEIIGKVNVMYNGQNIAAADLRIAESIDAKRFLDFLGDIYYSWREIIQ